MPEKISVRIYTDGAARGNPGRAGWAAVIIYNNSELKVESVKSKVIEIGGRVEHATNNQMELTAPIEALKHIKNNFPEVGPMEIISDSKYVILGITEWIYNWQKNGWRNAAKKPVLNKELWQKLDALNQGFKPKWTYVEGHTGDKWNERADEIATTFADNESVELRN